MKQTRIISAFPGTGKTHFFENNTKYSVLDSDSSEYSWVKVGGDKVRHPDWPQNYLGHIQENIGKVDFILVSTHKEVRDLLLASCLHFYLVFPAPSKKDEYLKRYMDRASPQSFIDLLDGQWDSWIAELVACSRGCTRIVMEGKNHHLDNMLGGLMRDEEGED